LRKILGEEKGPEGEYLAYHKDVCGGYMEGLDDSS